MPQQAKLKCWPAKMPRTPPSTWPCSANFRPPTPVRLPRCTWGYPLSAATFRSWHGSRGPIARDQAINAGRTGFNRTRFAPQAGN